MGTELIATGQIDKFSADTWEALNKEGYPIFELKGESIDSLRQKGQPFWSTWHRMYPEIENLRSRLSEVAFKPEPERIFLPDSNDKTYEQLEEMVSALSRKLNHQIPGTKAVIGSISDYLELAANYQSMFKGRDKLLGEKYGFNFIITTTKFGPDLVILGNSRSDNGWFIRFANPLLPMKGVRLSPLIIPSTTK